MIIRKEVLVMIVFEVACERPGGNGDYYGSLEYSCHHLFILAGF